MADYAIILCACFLLFFLADAARDDCSTTETQKGKCIALGECPPLLSLLKLRPLPPEYEQRLKNSTCGFQGIHPKVCCPLNVTDSTTPLDVVTTTHPVVTTTEPSLPELPLSSLLPGLKECGFFTEDRVFLGDEAQLDGYPWTVLLEYETPSGNGFHCGGVLINKRYVLTAAHCLFPEENWKLVSVRLGEYDRNSDPDCDNYLFAQTECCCADEVINRAIQEQIPHEQYEPNNKTRHNDIALLRLAHDVKFSEFIRPICLQPVDDLRKASVPGKFATISGWGITELTSNSNKKQHARMQVKANAECESAYAKKGLQLTQDQICAFAKDTTSCSQDSGGALMNDIHGGSSHWNHFALGVMSFSHPVCGLKEYPVIYTKVETHIPWIISKLKP